MNRRKLILTAADEIEKRAANHAFGTLQSVRSRLHGSRRVSKTIFRPASVKDGYAFHFGGRKELQFNIGLEKKGKAFRHGVAFSLETSRTLPSIDVLIPKIERFNEFLRVYPDEFSDLRMWHFTQGERSGDYTPTWIPPERCVEGVFVFLGRHYAPAEFDADMALADFDRLLPLYEFVESADSAFPVLASTRTGLRFEPGCNVEAGQTTRHTEAARLDVKDHHRRLQLALYDRLVAQHGKDRVGTEQPVGTGGRIDLVVKAPDGNHYYEIKTDLSARACVRAAIAQLLEYSFWPTAEEAVRLIVVGEPKIDDTTAVYLEVLRKRMNLPIYYERQRALVSSQ